MPDDKTGGGETRPLRYVGKPGLWYDIPLHHGEIVTLPPNLYRKAEASPVFQKPRGRKPKNDKDKP